MQVMASALNAMGPNRGMHKSLAPMPIMILLASMLIPTIFMWCFLFFPVPEYVVIDYWIRPFPTPLVHEDAVFIIALYYYVIYLLNLSVLFSTGQLS